MIRRQVITTARAGLAPTHNSKRLRPSAQLLSRSFVNASIRAAPQYPPPPPPGGGRGPGSGGGFPIGNIFGQQPREPGAALKEHGTDLTELARQGKLDPVIGRDEEIKRTIQILSRRTKVSPNERLVSAWARAHLFDARRAILRSWDLQVLNQDV